MKRVAIFSALLAMGGIYGGATHAADGTISFKGSLTAAPCSIDASSSTQTVDFRVVSASAFSTVGSVGPSKPFKIELTGCDTSTYTSAAVRFDGTAVSGSPTLLATDNDGLAIELTDASGARVNLGSVSSYVTLDSSTTTTTGTGSSAVTTTNSDGSGALSFRARYSALKARTAMTAGAANATASFTIKYR